VREVHRGGVNNDLTGLRLRPELLAAGYSDDELRRMCRSGEIARVRPGAYVRGSDERLRKREARHALAARAAAAQLPDGAVISHTSAAVLLGLPVWGVPLDRVHATRSRSSGGHRSRTLHLHTAPVDPDEVVDLDGVPVTTPTRTLVDMGRTLPFEQAVAVTDAALFGKGVARAELERAVERSTRRPGNRDARRVVAFANGGGESVGESRSRVLMDRLGLPRPVLQWEVPARRWVGRADFGWPELRTVGEFDGRIKYGRLLRPGQDPGDAVFAEKLREDAIRDAGFRVVRWVWDDLDDFDDVVERLWAAFRAA
jgi:putative AbiEi antitoxin of type IV toxin-antitoxin system